MITRREFMCAGAAVSAGFVTAGCRSVEMRGTTMGAGERRTGDGRAAREGQLTARPQTTGQRTTTTGQHQLKLDNGRDCILYVPEGYRQEKPAPLALMLHGAGGNARHGISLIEGFAEKSDLIVLAPGSRDETWDVILNRYGPDVSYIDRALEETFKRCAVDTGRMAIGGFSDGASYALSLGLINGDLFTHVIAFSPGFMVPTSRKGSPRLFISHGTQDRVLPIDRCSRVIVPQAKRAGYDVLYREFEGPHVVPPDIAREAMDWFFTV